MKPKRIFQVYREQQQIHSGPAPGNRKATLFSSKPFDGSAPCPNWRWRLIATRNGQIVGGSQEAFDSRGNALRAARREASFYQPGVAAVEVAQ